MFALQAGVLAVLVVGAVAGIPRPSSINTTETAPVANVIVKENALKISLPASITGLKLGLAHYEKRTRVFLDNMRREYFTMSTDRSRFLAELVEYMDSLPKNGTKTVTQKYRESCYCDSAKWSPCPERCMYSCKIGYNYYNDCSKRSDHPCYCEDSSSKRCDYGAISNCYSEKLEVVPDPSPCGNFSVDQSLITGSYTRFAHLLIEPLRVLVRRLEFQVKSLKQSVLAAEMVLNITVQLCDGQDTTCFPEAAEILSQKLSDLSQLQRNITFDMIQAQNKAESVEKDVEDLKEQTFNQINQSIREYVCCLKGLKFSVKDNDCAPKTVETAVQPLRPTHPIRWCQPPNFKCDNARCIPQNSVCDGADDCGDLSDELNC